MAGGGVERVLGGLMQTQYSSQPLEAIFGSGSSSNFLGSSSMVSFADVCGGKRSERPFFHTYDQDDTGDEDFDDYFHQPEKKRRLTVEQVRFLEKSFESENKLEPERKVQLAKDLGLQPRQVAIWFQNRRARWKTKQLEKDYDALQASYNSLKAEYDSVLKEKEKLQAEVVHLTDKLNLKHKVQVDHHSESSNSEDQSKAATNQPEPAIDSASETEGAHVSVLVPPKQEDLSSAKSDVLDSDSSHYYADGGGGGAYSVMVDPAAGDSSYAFEADHSDISQDDEEYLISLMPPSNTFPSNSEYHVHTPLFWPCWDPNLKM